MRLLALTVATLSLLTTAASAEIGNIAVTNGASFAAGLPAPGSVGTIFCTGLSIQGIVTASGLPLPLTLAGVSVTVGGAAAPLYAVADSGTYQQINFQVPTGPSDGTRTVVISQNGITGTITPSGSAENYYDRGDFFHVGATQYGTFQHSADYSTVTKEDPARPGEIVIGYATGLPVPSPQVPSGEAAPTSPLSVVWMSYSDGSSGSGSHYLSLIMSSGGTEVELTDPPSQLGAVVDTTGVEPVLFVGLAPGYAGLYQINFRVPQLPAGDASILIRWSSCATRWFDPCPAISTTQNPMRWQYSNNQPVLIPIGN
jgi:uncharacterized protein (TIGR03437 family)